MAVIPLRGRRTRAGFGAIVTPGQSTYPSQDGTFTIVRGTGTHWGNGLIDGWIIGGATADGYYALDSNDTGSMVDDQTVGRRYKVGSEYDAFVNSSETSPEYIAYEISLRLQQEAANPRLKAYDDALRAWAQSQQPPVQVDPVYGFATNYDPAQAPMAVQVAFADFTGNPIPQPPPPPAGPAEYVQGGVRFDDAGNVYDSSGNLIAGEKLTPAEVASLKATGSLPAGDTGPAWFPGHTTALTPPPQQQPAQPPATSSSAPPGATGGASDGSSPATGAGSSSTSQPAGPQPGSSGPTFQPSGGPMTLPTDVAAAAAPSSGSIPWGMVGLIGAGIVGAVVLSRAHSKGGRRR
jgi:hypothetical protein